MDEFRRLRPADLDVTVFHLADDETEPMVCVAPEECPVALHATGPEAARRMLEQRKRLTERGPGRTWLDIWRPFTKADLPTLREENRR